MCFCAEAVKDEHLFSLLHAFPGCILVYFTVRGDNMTQWKSWNMQQEGTRDCGGLSKVTWLKSVPTGLQGWPKLDL